MYTLVQEGIRPLSEDQMLAVVATVESFMEDSRPDGALRFDLLVEAMQDPDTSWDDLGRAPTGLEIMAACCALEKQGQLRINLLNGLMYIF